MWQVAAVAVSLIRVRLARVQTALVMVLVA
jgi:hypothetical protein